MYLYPDSKRFVKPLCQTESMHHFLVLFAIVLLPLCLKAQGGFTRADTLRGMLTPERVCYDVTFYDLDIRVDPDRRWIGGRNAVHFTTIRETRRIQVDLFEELKIQGIRDEKGHSLKFDREGKAVFVQLHRRKKPGERGIIHIQYAGNPRVARNPPWDGGLVWEQDLQDNPWVSVACQGIGASVWWPNKDHPSDEPDSMRITVTVPPGLMNVSNGRLRDQRPMPDGWTRYEWFVHHPINNYGVTINVGVFTHFREWYVNPTGDSLSLDYYVMPENLDKARAQFMQVPPMLRCFEDHFGPYPFPKDGYKIVESPYAGMEHQSAIAYGNRYQNGYLGRSDSKEGHWFDYILIHESAHEWFGNSVTAGDIADMWIQESFATYMEVVYVECLYGYAAAQNYMQGLRKQVLLDRPVLGTYKVHREGSRDMYPKGALMLHTLRQVVNNDELWWNTLRDLALTYRHQIVDYKLITDFMSTRLRMDASRFFAQYLKVTPLPALEMKWVRDGGGGRLTFRWVADIVGFYLPVKVFVQGEPVILQATSDWKSLNVNHTKRPEVRVDPNWFIEFRYLN
jgi:aminopeptidase N